MRLQPINQKCQVVFDKFLKTLGISVTFRADISENQKLRTG